MMSHICAKQGACVGCGTRARGWLAYTLAARRLRAARECGVHVRPSTPPGTRAQVRSPPPRAVCPPPHPARGYLARVMVRIQDATTPSLHRPFRVALVPPVNFLDVAQPHDLRARRFVLPVAKVDMQALLLLRLRRAQLSEHSALALAARHLHALHHWHPLELVR